MRRPNGTDNFSESAVVILVGVLIAARQCYATINPGCDCVTFQGSDYSLSGEFTSPSYPSSYRTEISCLLYTFVAPPERKMIVEVLFTDLDLGEVNQYNNCNTGDKLKVYLRQTTPSINDRVLEDTQICGNLSTMTRRTLYSHGPVLILELITDNNNSPHRGFKGIFNFIDASEFTGDGNKLRGTQCTYYVYAGAKAEGKIFSPNYPHQYPPNSSCEYKFIGDWDEKVQVTFLKIDLATQGLVDYRTCDVNMKNSDIIIVHDGDNPGAPVIGRYCGYHNHEEVLSTGKRLMIRFTSNEWYSMQGFAALFKFVKQRPADQYTCDVVVNSTVLQSGEITSKLYPQPYKSASMCVYKFNASPKERIAIKFIDFDLGAAPDDRASCSLQDKMVVRIRVDGTYLSTLKTFCGSTLPPSIMSNGPYIQLEFQAGSLNSQARGFKFEYKFITDFGIEADETVPYAPCVNKYRRSKNVEGVIVSPNFPGLYPKDTVCYYLFYGEGRQLMINFTDFDVSGHPPGCLEETNSDYVSLSNFMNAEDKKMSRYCADKYAPMHILRHTIVSDSDFFRITFKSGMAGSGTGFRAVYRFIEPEESTVSDPQVSSAATALYSLLYSLLSLMSVTLLLYG